MNDIPSQLEILPNELLIHVFQYFDARDLFQAFYNLNIRFNRLLESLNFLSLTLLKFDSNEVNTYDLFTRYIYTLKIDHAVNIDLNSFKNLHRLILISPTTNQLKQIVFNSFPYLEHLTIGYEHFLYSSYISDLCERIFSNKYPRLTSCYFYEPRILEIIPNVTPSIQIRILKMDNIDICIYKYILSLCPNLYFFQFNMLNQDQENFSPIKPHLNLKHLKIKFQNLIKSFLDYFMTYYLSCLPNLERFSIYEINFDGNLNEYLNYHWFASVIHDHLPSLQRFTYYLSIYGIKDINENLINDIQTNFQHINRDQYRSRLILHLS